MRRLLLLVPLLALAPAAAAATAPGDLLLAMQRAAHAQRSVHVVDVGAFDTNHVTIVGDAGRSAGRQVITFRRAGRTGHVTVLVVGDSAYVRGDAFALRSFMGFKAAGVARFTGRWVLVPHTDRAFPAIAAAVRLDSLLGELLLGQPLSTAPETTVAGRRVIGVRGLDPAFRQAVEATIWVQASGPRLPVREIESGAGVQETSTFDDWNRPVRIVAPAGATPIAQTGLE